MKWASAAAETADPDRAMAGLRDEVIAQLDGAAPDVAAVFFTGHFRDRWPTLRRAAAEAWPGAVLAGCSALGVIGQGREIEGKPAVSVAAARLPGVEVAVRHVDLDGLPDDDAPPEAWRGLLDLAEWKQAHLVVFADPFSGPVEALLSGLDYAWPSGTKIGGVASGGGKAGENVLLAGSRAERFGAVVLALRGNVAVDPIVAQGCRPIGAPLAVTCCEGHLILELDGRPPAEYLKTLLPTLPPAEREQLPGSLFLGLQMDPLNSAPGPGDYLVRNLIGIDRESGAVAVGAHPVEGQIVQFHLRDRQTSAQDLARQLDTYRRWAESAQARGVLMFACVGRGQHLYGRTGQDSELLAHRLGTLPAAGFFANGEIGPVAGATHVHGYTSALGIFRSLVPEATDGGGPPAMYG